MPSMVAMWRSSRASSLPGASRLVELTSMCSVRDGTLIWIVCVYFTPYKLWLDLAFKYLVSVQDSLNMVVDLNHQHFTLPVFNLAKVLIWIVRWARSCIYSSFLSDPAWPCNKWVKVDAEDPAAMCDGGNINLSLIVSLIDTICAFVPNQFFTSVLPLLPSHNKGKISCQFTNPVYVKCSMHDWKHSIFRWPLHVQPTTDNWPSRKLVRVPKSPSMRSVGNYWQLILQIYSKLQRNYNIWCWNRIRQWDFRIILNDLFDCL